MGKFITFEGIEGCGKSTQVKKIRDAFALREIPYIATEEPGGSGIGKKIRSMLLNKAPAEIAPEAELLLFMADRAQHVREVILPALNRNQIVVCDRFADATIAYQGFGRGLDTAMIEAMNRFACGGLKPDLTFLLDISVEAGLRRANERNAGKEASQREDRFESEALDFHDRVREGYLYLAGREPLRFRIINASKSIDAIQAEIWAEIEKISG